MPYIKCHLRILIDPEIESLIEKLSDVAITRDETSEDMAGMLTYCFFKIVKRIYGQTPRWYHKGDVTKILHSVQSEFDRRVMAPYEDKKIAENGDV